MIIFENDYNIKEKTVLTLGKFDGIHEGHQKLIKTTVDLAREKGCKSLVYVFNQNPKNVLNGERIHTLISKEEKIETLEKMGVDYLVFQDFTYEFSQISSEVFIKEIIKDKLKAQVVVVGFNHRFGKDAEGNTDTLERLSKKMNFEIQVIAPVKKDGEIISSSLLRESVIV